MSLLLSLKWVNFRVRISVGFSFASLLIGVSLEGKCLVLMEQILPFKNRPSLGKALLSGEAK